MQECEAIMRAKARCFIFVFLFLRWKTSYAASTTNLLHPEENLDRHWNRTNTKQITCKMPTQMQHANRRDTILRLEPDTQVHTAYDYTLRLTGQCVRRVYLGWLISEKVDFHVYLYRIPVSISVLVSLNDDGSLGWRCLCAWQ